MADAARIPFAVWLLPAAADAAWLGDRIHRLAFQHGGPGFDPHITLHVGSCLPEIDLAAVLSRVSGNSAALTLAASRTGESPLYFKALFVGIASDRADAHRLDSLRRHLVQEWLAAETAAAVDIEEAKEALRAKPRRPLDDALAAYEFLPHLSLLYGKFAEPLRQELARQQELEGRSICFDCLAAVRPAAGFADLSRIEGWHTFGHCRLGSPGR